MSHEGRSSSSSSSMDSSSSVGFRPDVNNNINFRSVPPPSFRSGRFAPTSGVYPPYPYRTYNRSRPEPSLLWPEPSHFDDDEPLLAATNTGDSTTPKILSESLTLKAFPELAAVAASDCVSKFATLVGIRAPSLLDHQQEQRAPIDLVAVLDVSGSMAGAKLELVKRAVHFVIDNLSPSDRLSIVAFSCGAQRMFPLHRMSEEGRKDAALAVANLISEGSTNILAGLEKGVRVLEERSARNPVASIMLLSDGCDTCDLHSYNVNQLLPVSICPAAGKETSQQPPTIPVQTFGFGEDHDPATMHAISNASGGTFAFIESIEIIQDAFAMCIGGLLSVVAREVRLSMTTLSPGVKIESIPSGTYLNYISEEGRQGVIDVRDLYADEEKEFLVYLSLPRAADSEGSEESKTLLMDVACSYKDCTTDEIMQVRGERVEIRRPEILSPEDTVVRFEVDRQRNRLMVADGIAKAQEMADKGNLSGAQMVLTNCRSTLLSSSSARAGDALCSKLEAELREIRERMASQETYDRSGRAFVLCGMSSHAGQRATTQGGPRSFSIQQQSLESCEAAGDPSDGSCIPAFESALVGASLQQAFEGASYSPISAANSPTSPSYAAPSYVPTSPGYSPALPGYAPSAPAYLTPLMAKMLKKSQNFPKP
ncbi:hypothetical protein RJ639_038992 [Escallonia herrerae]|uniref:VWFA domain-containing protein n=1 Tax=Escallonia herrerae TaxID=1293975 RepID=A0AA88WHT4_9ASTE|nr:hypothetical protein RJ639_038992 [Escallonia herrerae]